MSGAYISIVSWAKYQHYKDRNPPWIKLHRDLLTSETWVSSSDASKALAIALMMLAAEHGNRIPANPRYIQRRAYLEKEPDLQGLVDLQFIEIVQENDDASKPLADCKQVAPTETENREQKEGSVADATGAVAPQGPSAVDLKAAVFSSGVRLLMAAGDSERNARSMIGRWCKQYREGPTLEALAEATAKGVADPKPWINRRLQNGQQTPTGSMRGARPDPSFDMWIKAQHDLAACEDPGAGGGTWPALPPGQSG